MDPFTKRVKSQQEKDALIAEARREWDEGELTHLVGDDQESFLANFGQAIIVEQEPFVEPRQLTKAERDALDSELLVEQIFGDRISKPTGIETFDRLDEQEREAFRKSLAPAVRSQNTLEVMVESAISKAVATALTKRAGTRSESDRTGLGIMPRLAAATEGNNSDAARFVRAYVENDEQTMRGIARSLAAA